MATFKVRPVSTPDGGFRPVTRATSFRPQWTVCRVIGAVGWAIYTKSSSGLMTDFTGTPIQGRLDTRTGTRTVPR